MITGIHCLVYSKDAAADRRFFKEVLLWPHVDDGDGWLIFATPPCELGVHPAEQNGMHEIHLMCQDIQAFADQMQKHGIAMSEIKDEGWGIVARITLPGGGNLCVYQPLHAQPD